MRMKPLATAALIGASTLAIATPAAAAEIYASMSGAGNAYTWSGRTVAEICDTSADSNEVAVQYYRDASPSTLRTIWVETGSNTCNQSGTGSNISKLRIREQQLGTEDRYSSWHY